MFDEDESPRQEVGETDEYGSASPRDAVLTGMTEKRSRNGSTLRSAAAALRMFGILPKDEEDAAEPVRRINTSKAVRYSRPEQPKSSPEDDDGGYAGVRIAKVMEKLYLLVASADIGGDSYHIESGTGRIVDENEAGAGEVKDSSKAFEDAQSQAADGSAKLPRRGRYEALLTYLLELVDDDSSLILKKHWSRKSLMAAFDEGRTEVASIVCIRRENEPQYIQLRFERIPETSGKVRRYRGIIYIKAVTSQYDNGMIQNGLALENKAFIEDPDLAALFDGIYEIDIDGDRLFPYEKKKGRFVRMEKSYCFSGQIDSYARHGIIPQETQSRYMRLLDENFLKKAVRDGQYIMETVLNRPGSRKAKTYSEILVPIGRSRYRVYRNDIDRITQYKAQQSERLEQARLDEYNQIMLITMAGLVEFRNVESGPHIAHVSELVRILLTDLSERSPHYGLNKSTVDMYAMAAVMHDIGKIAVPDAILNKPGALSEEEQEIMRSHTLRGAQIIDRIHARGQEEMLACCRDVALHHHERYDGGGYPEGLKGDEISIGVQAVSLADVFDALISPRSYKDVYAPSQAYRMILDGECGSFGPRLIETFKAVYDKMCDIYRKESLDG